MEITSGIIKGKAKKVVVYGPEGIGKSTFASKFPNPVFIDTEGSTAALNVRRLPAPTSWTMLLEEVKFCKDNDVCKTLVIDTADWAEQLCNKHVCSTYQKNGIEDFGYGKGYVYVKEEFGKLLNLCEDLIQKGINICITAHAMMRKFEQPDETGAYDRWELKLSKQCSQLLKEWADMLLFANYKTHVVKIEKKNKVQGGKRVLYTSHHSCWDAKNRYNLPEEIPFDYDAISELIPGASEKVKEETPKETPVEHREPVKTAEPEIVPKDDKKDEEPESKIQEPPSEKTTMSDENTKPRSEPDKRIPKALRDLMIANSVDEWDIQNVVANKGYFPPDMPVWDYPEDFIDGVLVGAWSQVYSMIKEMKEKMEIPFN